MILHRNYLILFSLLALVIVRGQEKCSSYFNSFCEKEFNNVRINTYKAIIFSKELESNSKCHLVTIQSVSLDMKYEYPRGFYDIKESKDSISIDSLRKQLPESYRIYEVKDHLTNISYGSDYLDYFINSDNLHIPKNLEDETCNLSYDVIRIYEPLDKWAATYSSNVANSSSKEIIPVMYEKLKDGFIVDRKYLLYEIEIESNGVIKSIRTAKLE